MSITIMGKRKNILSVSILMKSRLCRWKCQGIFLCFLFILFENAWICFWRSRYLSDSLRDKMEFKMEILTTICEFRKKEIARLTWYFLLECLRRQELTLTSLSIMGRCSLQGILHERELYAFYVFNCPLPGLLIWPDYHQGRYKCNYF